MSWSVNINPKSYRNQIREFHHPRITTDVLFYVVEEKSWPAAIWEVSIYIKKGIPPSGGALNKKDRLTGYGDSHVKDKTS